MNKTRGNKFSSLLAILLSIILIANPLSHIARNLLGLGEGITYYVGYISWVLLFSLCILKRKVKVRQTEAIFTGALLATFILGACLWGERCLGGAMQDIHTGIFVCIAIFVTMAVNSYETISEKQLMFFLRIIVIFGVFFSLYAMIFQRENMIGVLLNHNKSINAWKYKSLFSQRNVFAQYCYISSIAACYLFTKTKKKRYFLCLLVFLFQIIITNSRAGLLGVIGLLGLSFYFKSRNKWLLAFLIILMAAISAFTLDIGASFLERFTHLSGSGVDSGQVRLSNWQLCIKYVFENHGYLFGFGNNSVSLYLYPKLGYGSSHNVYVDTFFNGGVVYESILLYLLWRCFMQIRAHKSDADDSFVCVWSAAFISWAVYCIFEAGISMFTANFFSVTITILLALIPRLYEN